MKRGYPVMLIHLPGHAEKFMAHSVRNLPQCEMAMKAVECLAKVTKKATVSICCYYVGDAKHLAETMQKTWGTMYEKNKKEQIATLKGLQVRTVHGFIGQETDISIIVTGAEKGPGRETDWLYAKEPGNVAISRGKQGVIIIGNMDYLGSELAQSLGRFIRMSAEKCPIIDGERFGEMIQRCTGNSLMWKSYVKSHQGTQLLCEPQNPNPMSLIAACELNRNNNWF